MKKELILIDHCHRLLRDLELLNKKQRVFLRELTKELNLCRLQFKKIINYNRLNFKTYNNNNNSSN